MSAIICYKYYLLCFCRLPRCPCHLRRHSRLPSHPCCLVVALQSPCRRLAVASPSPHPPFRPPSSSSRPPSPPHKDSDGDGDGDRHRHRRSLSLPVLLPPPTPFFLPPSPLPPSPLSGCVRRVGRSGGTATPAVIRDGPDGVGSGGGDGGGGVRRMRWRRPPMLPG